MTFARLLRFVTLTIVIFSVMAEEDHSPKRNSHLWVDTLPQPVQFNIAGLTDAETAKLKTVPGVETTLLDDGRIHVSWLGWHLDPEKEYGYFWTSGSERIYDVIPIKGQLGNTKWTHGGRTNASAGIINTRFSQSFNVKFDDFLSGHNEILNLAWHPYATPGQIEHELMRDFVGVDGFRVIPCGKGFVLHCGEGPMTRVAWRIDELSIAHMEQSFDPEMVAAYIAKFGCVTPKGFESSVDANAWMEEEIIARFKSFNEAWRIGTSPNKKEIQYEYSDLLYFTPEVKSRFNYIPGDENGTLIDKWTWLYHARRFFWANRQNFHRVGYTWMLNGPDLYDPKNPPELPAEITDPPKPE